MTVTERETAWVPQDTFGARLALVRHQLGRLSVEEAAQRCGLAPSTWRTWEAGVRPQDTQEVVRRIAGATGADRDWLMWGGHLVTQDSGCMSEVYPTDPPDDEQLPLFAVPDSLDGFVIDLTADRAAA